MKLGPESPTSNYSLIMAIYHGCKGYVRNPGAGREKSGRAGHTMQAVAHKQHPTVTYMYREKAWEHLFITQNYFPKGTHLSLL